MSSMIITININDIEVGNNIVNLGEVLEIDDQKEQFSIVILRHNQKQVFKFLKDEQLHILISANK
jgi:hypothetical protein